MDSEILENCACEIRNPGLRNPDIPITIGNQIQVPLTDRLLESSAWNLESTVWNPESRTVMDSLIWGYRVESGAPNVNFWKISVRKTI